MSAPEHRVTVVSLKNALDLKKASGKKKEEKKKKGVGGGGEVGIEEGEKIVYFSVLARPQFSVYILLR